MVVYHPATPEITRNTDHSPPHRRPREWRRALPALLLTALLGIFAACTPATTAEAEAEAAGAGAGAATVADTTRPYAGIELHILANDHPWVHHITQFLSDFTRTTGATVAFELYPEEQFRAKRTVEMLSGITRLDAFMIMPGNSLSEYHVNGWVEPLDQFISGSSRPLEREDFFPEALAAGSRDGTHYTVPILLETSILAYNKEIFNRYGITVPRTMEELERAASTVFTASAGETYGITMRGRGISATSQWADFLHSFGGSWFAPDGSAAIHTPESLAALELYGRLLREYGPRDATGNGWYESLSLFMRGEAAMIFDANVFRTHYEDPTQSAVASSVGYAMVPAGPAGSVPHISHWGLAIHPDSSHKEVAWAFIHWATTRERIRSAHLAGIPSPRMSVWEDPEVIRQDPAPEWTLASTRSYGLATYQWNPPVIRVDEARAIVGEVIGEAIIRGDLADAARRASDALDRLVREEAALSPAP